MILFNKGRVTPQENVHNHAETPHVGLRIVGSAFEDFGGDVTGCAALSGEAVGGGALFGEAEIGNFDVNVIVGGLWLFGLLE